MADINKIINPTGRIKYNELTNLITKTSITDFTNQIQHPFLVGQELYEGDMRRHKDAEDDTSTMQFSVSSLRAEIAEEQTKNRIKIADTAVQHRLPKVDNNNPSKTGIQSAIYVLRKKSFSKESKKNVFTVGRHQQNDLVIADFVISKFHAAITSFFGKYFVMDFNSTNGVTVNGKKINSDIKVQLPIGANIVFGRVSFMFISPLNLYRILNKTN